MEALTVKKNNEKVLQIQEEVTRSLSMGILCSLAPGGLEYDTYHQDSGEVRYASSTFEAPLESFFRAPFPLASNLAQPLSNLIKHELQLPHSVSQGSLLTLIATYPFIFVTYGLTSLANHKPSSRWDTLRDITFTHFMSIGGQTGLGVDAIGFVIAQESRPGYLIEAAGFSSPTSIIAPGYSDIHVKFIKKQESNCLLELTHTPDSPTSSFIEELSTLDPSQVGVKIVYGVSSAPFNSIEEVISRINAKKKRTTPK